MKYENKQLTILEVYKWALEEADYHKEQAVTCAKNKQMVESGRHTGLSMAFYQVAAKLENTNEINPIKN